MSARAGAAPAASPQAPAPSPPWSLAVPSETSFLALVRELTKKMAEAAGFDEGTPDQLALAVDEAATNVIEHAYRGAPDREVEVRFEDRGAEFRVEVIDTGAMVDPRSVPARGPRALRDRAPHGRPGRAPHGEDHGLGDVPAHRRGATSAAW